MTIGGTFTSPKVGIDMESLAKQAAQQAIKGLGEKLLGTGNKEQSDSTSTTTTNKTDKAKETVGKVLDLFKKK